MALLSQVGPSHCIRLENIKCMVDYSSVSNVGNSVDASKMKDTRVSFPSSPLKRTRTTLRLNLDSSDVRYKRGHRVAASPPTEDAVIDTEPLTKEDLVAYLASGCKTKEKWRFNF